MNRLMVRSALALTDSLIRQTPAGAKPFKLADGGGMYLLFRPDGARYWRLDYRFGGKRNKCVSNSHATVERCQQQPKGCHFCSNSNVVDQHDLHH